MSPNRTLLPNGKSLRTLLALMLLGSFPPPARADWSLTARNGARADLLGDSERPNGWRVEIGEVPSSDQADVQVIFPIRVEANGTGVLRFRARGAWGRGLVVGIDAGPNAPNRSILETDLMVEPGWQAFEYSFEKKAGEKNLSIHFDLGAEPGDVEVADAELLMAGASVKLAGVQSSEGNRSSRERNQPRSSPTTHEATPIESVDQPPAMLPAVAVEDESNESASTGPAAGARPESWRLNLNEGGNGQLVAQSNAETPLRVEISSPGEKSWSIQLVFDVPDFVAGDEYKVKLKARADQARSAIVAAGKNAPPWTNAGMYEKVSLAAGEWVDLEFPFLAKEAVAPARIYVDLGAEPGSVDLAKVELIHAGQTLPLAHAGMWSKVDDPAPTKPVPMPKPAFAGWEFVAGGSAAKWTLVSSNPWHLSATAGDRKDVILVARDVLLGSSASVLRVKTDVDSEVSGALVVDGKTLPITVGCRAGAWQDVVADPSWPKGGFARLELRFGTAVHAFEVADPPTR